MVGDEAMDEDRGTRPVPGLMKFDFDGGPPLPAGVP